MNAAFIISLGLEIVSWKHSLLSRSQYFSIFRYLSKNNNNIFKVNVKGKPFKSIERVVSLHLFNFSIDLLPKLTFAFIRGTTTTAYNN